jgi:hypothetical protein
VRLESKDRYLFYSIKHHLKIPEKQEDKLQIIRDNLFRMPLIDVHCQLPTLGQAKELSMQGLSQGYLH